MLRKRGQVFLIAALVISGVLISLAALYTTTQKPIENKAVYDLSSELNYETAQVIDQAVFTDISQSDLDHHIVNLTDYYVNQNPGNDIIIVYGNDSIITVREYTWVSNGGTGINVGGGTAGIYQNNYTIRNWSILLDPATQDTIQAVTINLTSTIAQTFRIVRGQNFISVIKKVLSNQTYVATGGSAGNEPITVYCPSSYVYYYGKCYPKQESPRE
jgi:hypothetical protein